MVDSGTISDIPKNLWDISVKSIDGKEATMGDFRKTAKAFLFVNVASACGFTSSNYKGLVELWDKYNSKGLEIFGFPCNQFGAQESECEADIKNFVVTRYKVEFPMFSKIEVNGANAHPVYKYLTHNSELYDKETGKVKPLSWNFCQFLVDKDGKVVKFFSQTKDLSKHEEEIAKLLSQ